MSPSRWLPPPELREKWRRDPAQLARVVFLLAVIFLAPIVALAVVIALPR